MGVTALLAAAGLVLSQTGVFAKVTKPHTHPPTALSIVKKITYSPQLSAFLHLKPQMLHRDLKHHESLLTIATKEKHTKTQLLSELSAIVRADVAKSQKAHHLSAAQAADLEKSADAMLPHLIVNTQLGAHKNAALSGGMIKEVATILHTTPVKVRADMRAHETILQMANAAHVKESVLISDLVGYRAKHQKHHASTAILTKQVERMIGKKL